MKCYQWCKNVLYKRQLHLLKPFALAETNSGSLAASPVVVFLMIQIHITVRIGTPTSYMVDVEPIYLPL